MIGLISRFDLAFEQFLYSVRDHSLAQFFIWVSELGGAVTIAGLTLVALIILAYRKKWPAVYGLVVSVLGSTIVAFILKELVARPRPADPLFAYVETSFSFPSGHATRAVAFFAFLLWITYDLLPLKWRKAATGVVAILILTIGFSRLYLGVHFPSDVIAGYLLGAVFVIVGIKITKRLSRNSSSTETK